MVDSDRVQQRLRRLDTELQYLERVRTGGWDRYAGSEETRGATERALQVSIQICIDIGAHLVAELGLPTPGAYAAVFDSLRRGDVLSDELADALSQAARQRNVLVHLYDDIDDRKVFATLERLEDLRAFARAVQDRLARG